MMQGAGIPPMMQGAGIPTMMQGAVLHPMMQGAVLHPMMQGAGYPPWYRAGNRDTYMVPGRVGRLYTTRVIYTLYHPGYTSILPLPLGTLQHRGGLWRRGGPGLKVRRNPGGRASFRHKVDKSVKSGIQPERGSLALSRVKRMKDWIAIG